MVLVLNLAAQMPASASGLAGSEWRPRMIGEMRVPEDSDIFMRFEARGRLEGHGGCSRFFGRYRAAAGTLIVENVGASRKRCDDSVAWAQRALLAALATVTHYWRDGAVLTLFDDGGSVIARLAQTDWD